jgi:uncharacterized protein
MPVRSLNSSVVKWPERQEVHDSVYTWAARLAQERQDVLCVGYIGSYARGDWGVGSDVDLIVILEQCEEPYTSRGLNYDPHDIPVPADVLVYTRREWQQLADQGGRFYRAVQREAVWVYERGGVAG